jgi:hypothetical protein
MATQLTTARVSLRVWQEERMGRVWRCAIDDGAGEVVVSFPDTAAMGDFIAEQIGLQLEDDERPARSLGDATRARRGGRPCGPAFV